MSEIDLRLEWAEQRQRERLEDDHYEGEVALEEEAVIEQQEALPPADEVHWPEEFEWSHDRALRWQAALGTLQGLTAARLQGHLRLLVGAVRRGEPVEDLLNVTEAWLAERLADWKIVSEVSSEEPVLAESFNQSLEAGANALGLAQEVIGLLRQGELNLVERLIEQVGSYLLEARDQLLAAEPGQEDCAGNR